MAQTSLGSSWLQTARSLLSALRRFVPDASEHGVGKAFNLIKVALVSLPRCDMPFTDSSIMAHRTKSSFTKQRDDKVHWKIGEEIAKLLEAKGIIMARNQ